MSKLEAIKYSNGKLQLLDQRLLPYETVYLDVPDPKAAWQQIKVQPAHQQHGFPSQWHQRPQAGLPDQALLINHLLAVLQPAVHAWYLL